MMAGVAAQQPATPEFMMASSEHPGSELYSRRSSVRAPAPNPNFSFPRQISSDSPSSSAPRKRIRPTDLSLLPYRPTDLDKPSTSPSTVEPAPNDTLEHSPSKSRPLSARSGHRRGGSEFIGGDGKTGGPGLMSTSPTKGVTMTAVPPPAAAAAVAAGSSTPEPAAAMVAAASTTSSSNGSNIPGPSSGPPAGRRKGHAHRRSGAMSTNDFTNIINNSVSNAPPLPTNLPGSAPASPASHMPFIPPMPVLERHNSQPTMTTQEKIDEANAAGEKEDREMAATPSSAGSRPRVVGFSDKVVVIPRPLSTISAADTASTMSTIRPSHSASGSLSSVLDQRPPTPVSASHPADSSDDSRPTTSDTLSQTGFFGPADDVVNNAAERPSSGSGNNLMKRRRSPPPSRMMDDEISPGTVVDPDFYTSMNSETPQSAGLVSPFNDQADSPNSNQSRSDKRKSGFRAILSLKSRKRSKEDATVATTPDEPASEADNVPEGLMSLDDVNFDEDTTCVIHSAGYEAPKPAAIQLTPSPHKPDFDIDDSAVLDLDATYDAVRIDDDSPNSFASFMRGTPGLRQHRRTESAPSLSPMQRVGFSAGKASPKMADVFEEEEGEEDDSSLTVQRAQRPKARSFHQPKTRNLQGLGVQIVDAEATEAPQPRRKSRSPSSKLAALKVDSDTPMTESSSDTITQREWSSHRADATVTATNNKVMAGGTSEPRFSTATKSSDDGTITPSGPETPLLSNPVYDSPLLDPTATVPHPLDFAPPPSLNPHAYHDSSDLSTSSTAPSPNPTTISFDAPRLHTATSSITDRTNWSASQSQANNSSQALPCHGDASTASEDVPSLTSSASTAFSGLPSQASTGTNESASTSPSPVVTRGPGFGSFSGAPSYHAHTVSGISRPRTMGFPSEGGRPNSVGADRAFSLAGLGGLSQRPSMPRAWGSRPSTANNSKRSSLASLSRLMSKGGDSERSKLSISWGAQDDGAEGAVISAKEGKDKGGKRRLSKMFKFWKGKDKERPVGAKAEQEVGEDVEMTT